MLDLLRGSETMQRKLVALPGSLSIPSGTKFNLGLMNMLVSTMYLISCSKTLKEAYLGIL